MLAPILAAVLSAASLVQAAPAQMYPLMCRGGGAFGVDTLERRNSAGIVVMTMRFTPSRQAAGSNGTGLAQGTCAWVDRPLNAAEPAQVRFAVPVAPTTTATIGPREALAQPDSYWRFFVYNTGQGYLEAAGHGAWTPPAASRPWSPFPPAFQFAFVFMLVMALPCAWIMGRLGPWGRLAGHYPATSAMGGRRIRCAFFVLGRSIHKGTVHLIVDPGHLHVRSGFLLRPGYPTISIPWSEISTSPDEYRWTIPPAPVVRLTLRRDPDTRLLIRPHVAEKVIEASGGRLRLSDPPSPPAPRGRPRELQPIPDRYPPD